MNYESDYVDRIISECERLITLNHKLLLKMQNDKDEYFEGSNELISYELYNKKSKRRAKTIRDRQDRIILLLHRIKPHILSVSKKLKKSIPQM